MAESLATRLNFFDNIGAKSDGKEVLMIVLQDEEA